MTGTFEVEDTKNLVSLLHIVSKTHTSASKTKRRRGQKSFLLIQIYSYLEAFIYLAKMESYFSDFKIGGIIFVGRIQSVLEPRSETLLRFDPRSCLHISSIQQANSTSQLKYNSK